MKCPGHVPQATPRVRYREHVLIEGLVVGIGASSGALLRFALTSFWPPNDPMEIAVTMAINIVACFLMGLYDPPPLWSKGILGGFSTLSAVALTSAEIYPAVAATYIGATVIICTGMWIAGDALRRRGHNSHNDNNGHGGHSSHGGSSHHRGHSGQREARS